MNTIENILTAIALMWYADEVGGYNPGLHDQYYDKAALFLGVKPLTEIVEEKQKQLMETMGL